MQLDLVLTGGTVVDPSQDIHTTQDIGVLGDKIVDLTSLESYSAKRTIDASGLLITPGLIDLHAHVYKRHVPLSIDADSTSLAGGVTTVLDAGSAGSYNFAGFKHDVIDRVETEVLGLVNLSCIGLVAAHYGELMDARYADPDGVVETIRQFPGQAVGVKIRAGAHIIGSGQQGWDNFLKAVQAARDSNTWLMIHIGECPMPLPEMIPHLQPGDCITHCFKGGSTTVLNDNQQIHSELAAARDNGIIFDVGHGYGSFHWDVAEAAAEQGFLPSTISTDLHVMNLHGPVFDMPTTMSKFLHLGVSLDDVIDMSTTTPARVLGRAGDLGTLAAGTVADITILEQHSGEFTFTDSYDENRTGNTKLTAVGIVRRGKLHLNSNRLV
jgi:dihydroorotase